MLEDLDTGTIKLTLVNGSWVNGYRLGKPYLFDIKKGEEVVLGECEKIIKFKKCTYKRNLHLDDANEILTPKVKKTKKSVIEVEEEPTVLGNISTNIINKAVNKSASKNKNDMYNARTPKTLRAVSRIKRKERTSEKNRKKKMSRINVGLGVLQRERSRSHEKENENRC